MRVTAGGLARRVAGTGVCGTSGDDGPPLEARLCSPRGLGFAPDGTLYIADGLNRRIRRIDSAGSTITTVAGSGECSYTVDTAGPTGELGEPNRVFVSASGMVYFSSQTCTAPLVHRITRFDPTARTFTTVVGGDAGADVTPDGMPAAPSVIAPPHGLAVGDDDSIFFSDSAGHVVRHASSTGILQTIAGNGALTPFADTDALDASVGEPAGLALTPSQNLVVATSGGYRVLRLNRSAAGGGLAPWTITAIAGDGTSGAATGDDGDARLAHVGRTVAIGVSLDGGVHFSSWQSQGSGPNAIKRIDGAGVLRHVAGREPPDTAARQASFYTVSGLATDGKGRVYVSSRERDSVWKVEPSGQATRIAGIGIRGASGHNVAAVASPLSAPEMLTTDADGNVFFVEAGTARVKRIDATGLLTTVAGGGAFPAGCVDAGIPAALPGDAGVNYNCFGDEFRATSAVLVAPRGLAYGDGALYVAEGDTAGAIKRGHRVRKIDLASGIITTVAGQTNFLSSNAGFRGDGDAGVEAMLNNPIGLAMTPQGDLLIVDSNNRRVRKLNLKSKPIGAIGTIAGTSPTGPPFARGDYGLATRAELLAPYGIAVEASTGTTYVSDWSANNVRRIDASGNIFTIAGTPVCGGTPSSCGVGYTGDGASALSAQFNHPGALAIFVDGELLVADSLNDRVRVITP
jgi:sugar lactone lactonase YvrE